MDVDLQLGEYVFCERFRTPSIDYLYKSIRSLIMNFHRRIKSENQFPSFDVYFSSRQKYFLIPASKI